MSRQYTTDEIRTKFLELVWSYIDYWDKLPDKPTRERLEGLAFGMLVILDGGSIEIPGFLVTPAPHPNDREYHQNRNEKWYPGSDVTCDIAGCLHELFYGCKPDTDQAIYFRQGSNDAK